MPGKTLTHPDGPVVVSETTFTALATIRKLDLIRQLYGNAVIGLENYRAVEPLLADGETPAAAIDEQAIEETGFTACPALPWLYVAGDRPEQVLPERIAHPHHTSASEAATLRLAIAVPASLVLIDGPIKEKAKLSFIKCEGTVSLLVSAYREGYLSAVKPMVVALEKLGQGHVLPPADLLEALWTALEKMDDA